MGLTTLLAQTVSILRAKLWKVVMKYKTDVFVTYGLVFSESTYLRLQHFFSLSTSFIQSTHSFHW